jgi:hypothetical protein
MGGSKREGKLRILANRSVPPDDPRSAKKTPLVAARRGAACANRYCFVLVSVSVFVAVPAGVSMRVVDVERDFSLVVPDLPASMSTLVEERDGSDGCTTVVDGLGALGAGWTTVVEELAGGASLAGRSFTTVVDELGTDRSQPATAAMAIAARGSTMNLMDVSVVH